MKNSKTVRLFSSLFGFISFVVIFLQWVYAFPISWGTYIPTMIIQGYFPYAVAGGVIVVDLFQRVESFTLGIEKNKRYYGFLFPILLFIFSVMSTIITAVELSAYGDTGSLRTDTDLFNQNYVGNNHYINRSVVPCISNKGYQYIPDIY